VVLPRGVKGVIHEAYIDPVSGQRRLVVVLDKPRRKGKNPGKAKQPVFTKTQWKDG